MPMTTRRRRGDDDTDDSDYEQNVTVTESNPNTTGTGVVTMTDAQLTAIVAAVSRSQAETNRQLFESFLSTRLSSMGVGATSTPTPDDDHRANQLRPGNFAKCTARYDGAALSDEALEAFIDSIEVYKECSNVSDEHALRGLPMLLTGEAAVWWQGVRAKIPTWKDALQRLRGRFGTPRPAHKLLREIYASEQGDERADAFACKLRALLCKLPYDVPEEMQLDIIYGLLDRKIRKYVPRDSVCDIDSLIEAARNVEESRAEFNDRKKPELVSRSSIPIPNTGDATHYDNKTQSMRARPRCTFCNNFGHTKEECRKCHNVSNVQSHPKTDSRKSNTVDPNSSTSLRCYGCGQLGVVRSKCDTCRPKNSNAHPPRQVDFNSAVVTNDTNLPRVHVTVMGRVGVAVVDTGATHTIASPALYNILLDHKIEFTESERNFSVADGSSQVRKVLSASVNVSLQGRIIHTQFQVLPGADTKTLLGRDFIVNAGMILDVPQGIWWFSNAPDECYDFIGEYTLPLDTTELMTAETDCVGLRDDEGSSLNSKQKDALNNFIQRRSDQFAPTGPATDFATHRIKVSDNQEPTASPLYRMSPTKKEALKKELERLLEEDVIEECESPWAANVVLVTKKDGGTRLCIDYRKLNAVTEADRYPLPRIEDILHAAKTSEHMTTLDLRAGYFQVSVHPDDRDKTAFITPLGTYRFKRMPMGLRNSGATFQRLMDRFKSNLPETTTVLAYLDDLVILSKSFDGHLEDLNAVFDRLKLFGLRVNRDKSHFARDSVKFLGHVIVPGGIDMDPEKVSAIKDMAPPRDVKQLKSFLQTSSWFRRFIPGYADVALPLTSLLKKVSTWKWESSQQNAFEKIKDLLTSAPILKQADESKPFILRTDSSGYALGAVLLQGEGADERPIEYASRLLSSAERNYNTTEREALAVVWAISKFRGYIDGGEVVVRSDHQPLRWLMSLKSPSGRLARWALALQEYDLRIEYTPGRANVVADTLSRPVGADDCELYLTTVDLPTRSFDDIRENQLKDPETRKIIEEMESDEPFRGRPWADRGYVLSDGILYRYGPDGDSDDDNACLVVPQHERSKVLADFHDAPTAGHFGTERTLARICSRFYWPGMRAYVANYIKECPSCQRYKIDTRKPAGLLQTPATARRFEVISVDLFGPLPETANGNKWVLIVEDISTRWVELFALKNATSPDCAKTLINEVFLRFGVPRRVLSDNGVQFISAVMQQACHCMGISQSLTPLYHPEANPVERKNRDLKPQLAILVGRDHGTWDEHLPAIRFAMNSAMTASTGFSPAYLTFARELRAPADAATDMRRILEGDNFTSSITPYLKKLSTVLVEARDVHEKAQLIQKQNADEGRRPAPDYKVGDLVLLKTQGANDTNRGQTPKFIPLRDGPYRIKEAVSHTTYLLERITDGETLGKYHVSQLTPFVGHIQIPVQEKRKRGRPRKGSANPNAGSHRPS